MTGASVFSRENPTKTDHFLAGFSLFLYLFEETYSGLQMKYYLFRFTNEILLFLWIYCIFLCGNSCDRHDLMWNYLPLLLFTTKITAQSGYVEVFPLYNISSLYFMKFGSSRSLLLSEIRPKTTVFYVFKFIWHMF